MPIRIPYPVFKNGSNGKDVAFLFTSFKVMGPASRVGPKNVLLLSRVSIKDSRSARPRQGWLLPMPRWDISTRMVFC